MSCWVYMLMVGIVLVAQEVISERHVLPSFPTASVNSTATVQEDLKVYNSTDSALGSRISTLLRDLPTIKNIVIFICVLTTLLIICLLLQMYRSGKKIRKTRKYDIITTPAERVEMAPLNDDNEDDEDSTLFDVKYS